MIRGKDGENGEAGGPSPYFNLLRIPSAPPLSASIFPQRSVSTHQENTVSARRSNCSLRPVKAMLGFSAAFFEFSGTLRAALQLLSN